MISPTYNDAVVTIGDSPAARSYRDLLTQTPKSVNDIIGFINTKATQLKDTKIELNLETNDYVNTRFNSFLDSNPKLRLSTTEYFLSALNNEVRGDIIYLQDFLIVK